ncbi:MAG: hypothetical protein FWE36_03250 [Erysipelotrichales bacterium]|nr:hypothetical protein [Erysipelotrichales bacterium]
MPLDLQIRLIFVFTLYGMFLHSVYLIFHVLIKKYIKKDYLRSIADLLFFLGQIILCFMIMETVSDGQFSFYLIIFLILGAIISHVYFKNTIFKFLIMLDFMIDFIGKWSKRILRFLFVPVLLVAFIKKLDKRLTKFSKNFKIRHRKKKALKKEKKAQKLAAKKKEENKDQLLATDDLLPTDS